MQKAKAKANANAEANASLALGLVAEKQRMDGKAKNGEAEATLVAQAPAPAGGGGESQGEEGVVGSGGTRGHTQTINTRLSFGSIPGPSLPISPATEPAACLQKGNSQKQLLAPLTTGNVTVSERRCQHQAHDDELIRLVYSIPWERLSELSALAATAKATASTAAAAAGGTMDSSSKHTPGVAVER
jgi:hypothetical protein